jgi:hypothetical protein
MPVTNFILQLLGDVRALAELNRNIKDESHELSKVVMQKDSELEQVRHRLAEAQRSQIQLAAMAKHRLQSHLSSSNVRFWGGGNSTFETTPTKLTSRQTVVAAAAAASVAATIAPEPVADSDESPTPFEAQADPESGDDSLIEPPSPKPARRRQSHPPRRLQFIAQPLPPHLQDDNSQKQGPRPESESENDAVTPIKHVERKPASTPGLLRRMKARLNRNALRPPPSSPRTTRMADGDESEAVPGKRKRASVRYTEPPVNRKMRQGVPQFPFKVQGEEV